MKLNYSDQGMRMRKSLPSGKNVALARLSSHIIITFTFTFLDIHISDMAYHFVDFAYPLSSSLFTLSSSFSVSILLPLFTDPGENNASSRDRLGKDNHAKRENDEGKPWQKHEISQNALQMCANHSILPWMDLRPNCGSQKVTALTHLAQC